MRTVPALATAVVGLAFSMFAACGEDDAPGASPDASVTSSSGSSGAPVGADAGPPGASSSGSSGAPAADAGAEDAGPPRSAWVPADYTYVFGDEFDQSQLDTSKWWTRYVYDDGELDTLSGNDEQQNYQEQGNHVMTGATLRLTAYKKPEGSPGLPYSSGMLRSKTVLQYGYLEARVKMPRGKGVWPAFWLNPEDQSWPPEIDVFEFVYNGVEEQLNMIHSGVIDHGPQQRRVVSKKDGFNTDYSFWTAPYDFPDDFHVIASLWNEAGTTTFIDGEPIVQYDYSWVHGTEDGGTTPAGYAHVLLNLAIGGAGWAGKHGIDDAAFPQALEIDYLRVYQKSPSTAASTTGHDHCPADGGC